jgi:chitodextrinase
MFRRHLPTAAASLFVLALFGCEKLPNVPPSASFIYSPVSPVYAGSTSVGFNASASRDSDGTIANYLWDFGDGSGEQSAGGPTVSHVFPDTAATCLEAIYTVLLTVVDNDGERASASQQVKVIELPAPTSLECQPQK